MPKKRTRKNLKKRSKRKSRKNLKGSGPVMSKTTTQFKPPGCKKLKKMKPLVNYCKQPGISDKSCRCVKGSPQYKLELQKHNTTTPTDIASLSNPSGVGTVTSNIDLPVERKPCKSKSCCVRKTCHADVEKCDKDGLIPCNKMPGCKLKEVSTPEGMRNRCQFEPQTEPTQPVNPIKPKKTPRLKGIATKVGKRAVARNIAARVGENFVDLFSNIKSKNGDDLIDPESLQPYGDWVKGTVASGAWKGEEFAYNKKTGEYIIYSQHVKQDDCEPCEWVLYPSVKYGTDKKIGFANIPGTLWYWNTVQSDWYEAVPEGVTFNQEGLKRVQDKLYGKKKSDALNKFKKAGKTVGTQAVVVKNIKEDVEKSKQERKAAALNKFKKAGKTVGKQAVVVKNIKEDVKASEERAAQRAALAARIAAEQSLKPLNLFEFYMGHGVTPDEGSAEELLVR